MNILGKTRSTRFKAQRWAAKNHASLSFQDAAALYWRFAAPKGVIPEVAYAQAAHETGFGKFGGVIDASYNNFCGLKTASGGGDGAPSAHMKFPTPEMGVIAHLDHLACYAKAPGYPLEDTPDPRHKAVYGFGATVEAMAKRWATSNKTYAANIKKWVEEMRK